VRGWFPFLETFNGGLVRRLLLFRSMKKHLSPSAGRLWAQHVYVVFIFLNVLVTAQSVHYPDAYTGNVVLQAGTPPFNASTPANTVLTMEPPYNLPMSRLTDTNTLTNGLAFIVPGGGSSDGVITNWGGTLIALTDLGGTTHVFGYNRATRNIWPTSNPSVSCVGATGFSRNTSAKWYCMPHSGMAIPGGETANGTTIYGVTFPGMPLYSCGQNTGCYDPTNATWTKVFDFATCPMATAAPPLWTSFLGVGVRDVDLSVSMSWTGVQGSAHLFFDYEVSYPHTCTTYDTVGNGTNPLWYTQEGVPNVLDDYVTGLPIEASYYIHDAWSNGTWAEVQKTDCNGADCGPPTADGPPIINLPSHTAYVLSDYPWNGGHFSMSATQFFNDSNPQFYQRALDNPGTTWQIADWPCSPCEDMHLSGDVQNDLNPVLGTRGGTATTTWTKAYMNELVGLEGATIYRFAPTWSSGSKTNFYGQYAIAGFSQDRRTAYMTSDMGCQLSSSCRTDVFAVDLTPNLQ
jgi:hypothetical protein